MSSKFSLIPNIQCMSHKKYFLEEGEGSGVTRDCFTEFWTDFYDTCTLGGDVKVLFIRHEYQSEEWQAIARILVVGWRVARYFPVKLATPFLEEALYGTITSSLKDTFLQCCLLMRERPSIRLCLTLALLMVKHCLTP